MHPRRFSLLAISTTIALVIAAWALGWWLQPLYGDLTRLGSYSERDFGWNEAIEEFDPLITSFGEWTSPVDILVIGDSFANLRPAQQWQNYLAARTGWRIHTLHIDNVDVEGLPSSQMYRAHPPKVVIWNIVERDVLEDYGTKHQSCPSELSQPVLALNAPRAEAVQTRQALRSQSLVDVNPGFTRAWLFNASRRAALGMDTGKTMRLDLTRSDFFSSRESDEVLDYRSKIRKRAWKEADVVNIRCRFAELAVLYQANGRTAFVTALAPTKLSAYRPWVKGAGQIPDSWLPRLLDGFPVPDARLDIALHGALSRAMKDVYMPDDTHWGDVGQKLAADAIFNMLDTMRSSRTMAHR